jgi:MSHA biogenesis protein MshE
MLAAGERIAPHRGHGCSSCHNTGYSGRQGVYEWLEMDAALTQAASRSDSSTFMALARERMRGQMLAHHVLQLVREGRTSLAEALRVGFDTDDVA